MPGPTEILQWLLKPRKDAPYNNHKLWESEVERPLREILLEATAGLDLPDEARLKYGASATEQEIARGALRVEDAREHVFCFFRKIKGLPEDGRAEGFRDLVLAEPRDRQAERLVPDREADELLENIKGPEGKLRTNLERQENFFHYEADWLRLPENLSAEEWEEIHRRLETDVPEESERAHLLGLVAEWYEPRDREQVQDASTPPSYSLNPGFGSLGESERVEVERSLRRAVFHEGRPPISTNHLAPLCHDVERVLSKVIREQIEKLENEEKRTTELDKEVADHERFRESRTRFFVGRGATLRRIAEYIAGADPHAFVLVGEPGSGKSAVLARAVEEARQAHPDAAIIFRFIGWTPGSAVIRELLGALCRQISLVYGAEEETPSEYRELVQEFPKRLERAAQAQRVLVFLDAVDQLSEADNARNLIWLPRELPSNVRLVVSTSTEPGDTDVILKRRLPEKCRFTLEDMPVEEANELLHMWFDDVGRTLGGRAKAFEEARGQWRSVLERYSACRRPLYLKLAFEEARRWRSFEEPENTRLAPDIPSLIEHLLARLSSPLNHGETIVSRSLGYLVAGKNGLTEDEMIEVLSEDDEVLKEVKRFHRPPEEKLPVVIWSRLHFDLVAYLTERSADETTLLAFYHRQLDKVARAKYLEPSKRDRHRALAKYFFEQLLLRGEKTVNIRKLSELPYQQTNAEMWDDLYRTLTDFEFLEAKCTHAAVTTEGTGEAARKVYGGVYELQEDYRRALTSFPGDNVPSGARSSIGPIIVTAWVSPADGNHALRCPLCQVWSEVSPSALGKELDCPHCGGRLRVNPFTINADWRPMTEA